MINLISQSGDVQYKVVDYVVDTPDDILELSTECAMGSSALVINTSELYMLNGQKEWVKL